MLLARPRDPTERRELLLNEEGMVRPGRKVQAHPAPLWNVLPLLSTEELKTLITMALRDITTIATGQSRESRML